MLALGAFKYNSSSQSVGTHQIVLCFGNIEVFIPQGLLVYFEGPAVVILYLFMLSLVLTNQCQVIQLLGHIWVISAQDLDTSSKAFLPRRMGKTYKLDIIIQMCYAVRDIFVSQSLADWPWHRLAKAMLFQTWGTKGGSGISYSPSNPPVVTIEKYFSSFKY